MANIRALVTCLEVVRLAAAAALDALNTPPAHHQLLSENARVRVLIPGLLQATARRSTRGSGRRLTPL
jgi:hypothetical protein